MGRLQPWATRAGVAGMLAWFGCGADGVARSDAPPAQDAGSCLSSNGCAAIGSAGGTIVAGVSGHEVTITVPDGALGNSQQLRIELCSGRLPTGQTALSAIYCFFPEGLAFAKPVTACFDYESRAGTRPGVLWSEGTDFVSLSSRITGGRMCAETLHFSVGFVAELGPAPDAATAADARSDAGASRPDAPPVVLPDAPPGTLTCTVTPPEHGTVNGSASATWTAIGTNAAYACVDGFALLGTAPLCGADGTLDGAEPTCTPIRCTATAPSHGTVDGALTSVTLAHGASASYGCDTGFALDGTAPSCGGAENPGSLTGPEPVCTPIFCATSAPANGAVEPASVAHGASAAYSCTSGHALTGAAPSCGGDTNPGSFSHAEPTCVPIRCTAQPPEHGLVEDDTLPVSVPYDGSASYGCVPGYGLVGAAPKCEGPTNPGMFDGAEPVCEPITCLAIAPLHGTVDGAASAIVAYGESASYSCLVGFVRVGTAPTCAGTAFPGELDGPEPTCAAIVCTGHAPTNGMVNSGTAPVAIAFGEMATYTCDNGYTRFGSAPTCAGTANPGSWSDVEPTCSPCSVCDPEEYTAAACTSDQDTVCAACSSIAHCADVTCTTASDEVCNTCTSGYVLDGNSCIVPIAVVGSPLLMAPSNGGSTTNGTLIISNLSTSATATDIAATLPIDFADVTQDATNCTTVLANATCTLTFSVTSELHEPASVTIAGTNTGNTTATLAVNRYAVPSTYKPTAFAIDRENHVLYMSGDFTSVGTSSGSFVPLSAQSGALLEPFPRVVGDAKTAIPDGAGGWYIGGYFTHVDGIASTRLAHIDADGILDPDFNPAPDSDVLAMVLNGTNLIVGGGFQLIGGEHQNFLAALDATTGAVTSWNPAADGPVRSLVLDGTTLYVGGDFDSIGGQARARVAALDVTLESNNATEFDAQTVDGNVRTLALDGTTLYAGGEFLTIGGESRAYLAALNTTGSAGTATSWVADADDTVHAIVVNGTTAYVGGAFTSIGTISRSRIAAIDLTKDTDNVGDFDPAADGIVYALALNGTNLLVGGAFTTMGGEPRLKLAAVDTTRSTNNVTAWNPAIGNQVLFIRVFGDQIYIAGDFLTANAVPRSCLAAIDMASGDLLPFHVDLNAAASALAFDNGTLYLGGTFVTVGGETRNRLAAIDTTNGMVTAWNPGLSGSAAINAMAVNGTQIIVAGAFTSSDTIGGQNRNRIAAINAQGNATAWDPNVGGNVNTMLRSGTTLYIGGPFTTVSATTRNRLAALDLTKDSNMLLAWDPGVGSGAVNVMGLVGTTLYVAGSFTGTTGGQTRSRIAALLTTVDTNNATSWNPGANNNILAGTLVGNGLVVGGNFNNTVGGQQRKGFAVLDTRIDTNNVTPYLSTTAPVAVMVGYGTTIYVAGAFNTANGLPTGGLGILTP